LNDEDLVEKLSIKLVKSICYHYSPEKPVAVIARILQEVIAAITGFAVGSTPHTVLANLKKRKEKDQAFTSIFGSFLEKLGKSKGYVPVKDSTQVDNPD